MNVKRTCKQLQALAQTTRLKIFKKLIAAGQQGVSAGDICQSLAVSYSCLSFHLTQLTDAEIIYSQRRGRFIFYYANYTTVKKLINNLNENCCQDDDGNTPKN